MDENILWQKFCQGGKVADYLEYRNFVNLKSAEMKNSVEDDRTGSCDKGTEYRGIR